MARFIGRAKELARLVETSRKASASFIVIKGRRRVGKRRQELLGVHPQDVVNENPYFQHSVRRHPGCQIDYLIQARHGTLYVCEIRFSRNPIGASIIPDVKSKIAALAHPRGVSYRPVLIHINGVTEEVTESEYFTHIIDAGSLLQSA